jgi:AhpD family alkylhydroperoxidase
MLLGMTNGHVDARTVQKGLARVGRALPDEMNAFATLHREAMSEGAIATHVKELMAMAVGIATGCSGCIAYHGAAALTGGATDGEFAEAMGVAILMGGGPAAVHGVEAMSVLDAHRADG